MISVEQKWERQEGGESLLYSNDVIKIQKYVDSHKERKKQLLSYLTRTKVSSLSKMKE